MEELKFDDVELSIIASLLEQRYGIGDELAEKIYSYLEEKNGDDPRV